MQYVEYIQNGTGSGRQRGWGIPLNYVPTDKNNISVRFKINWTQTGGASSYDGNILIGSSAGGGNFFRLFCHRENYLCFDCPNDSDGRVDIPFTMGQEAEFEARWNNQILTLTNLTTQQTVTGTTNNSPIFSSSWYVWKENSDISQGTKIYYIDIYEGNTKVKEYRPALDANDVPCLYEKLGSTYHYNYDSSKVLIAGPFLSSINASASKFVLATTGETINIVVNCENAWEVTGDTWLTLSSTGDTSGTTITATAPSYSGVTARTDTLTFTDSVTGDEAEITIKQKKYTTGQPFYLGDDEVTEVYLGLDDITEAYLGDVLVFASNAPSPTPTPTGGTRTISISSIPIPVLDGEGNAGQTDIYIEDENQNYASLNLTFSDPWDNSSYEENVDATQSFSATYASGYFEVEGEWGDDITITYSYTDGVCAGVPSGYDTEQPTFVNGVISSSFPTPESDPECECTNQGGTWDSENQECISDPCAGMGEEECECVSNGGTWVVPEIGDPYCEQGGGEVGQ